MAEEPRRPPRVTIYDVAREAGVAASTVSRAYSRPGRVHADTARRIFEASDKLGYRSSRLPLRTPDAETLTRAIGLVIADVTNPFYGEIIRGAYEAARQADHMLILSHTNESPTVERATIDYELARVDGIVIASSRMSDAALRTVAKQRPVVLLNRTIPEVSCVVTDNARGVRAAAEHLRALGHRTIHYVAGPRTSWMDGVRWSALRDAAQCLDLEARRLGPNDPTVVAGYRVAPLVRDAGATAVLAYNDWLAIGVMKGLRSLDVEIPGQVSVVGFDNIIADEIVEPGLTTVAAPLYRMGATGVRNCIAVARGAEPTGVPLVLPVHLVERQSTGRRCATGPPVGA